MADLRQIRDPVHGFIDINEQEIDIIDTPIFQRLRWIKQLAFAYLLYPCAVHSRFDHSLGVLHVASSMANSLIHDQEDKRLIRLTALLHDLGHGLFSHVSEEVLKQYAKKTVISKCEKNNKQIHELITEILIRYHADFKNIITPKDRLRIIDLLSGKYGDPVLQNIVTGPIDADKQDYLLRDSYFCGVKYGLFDINRLHQELRANQDPGTKQIYLMSTEEGIHTLEQFILAKFFIFSQVYGHRVRIITDQMLIRALSLAIDDNEIPGLTDAFKFNGTKESALKFIEWDDLKFLQICCDPKFENTRSHKLMSRLYYRNLLKCIFRMPLNRFEDNPDILRDISKPKNKSFRNQAEIELSIIIKKIYKKTIDPDLVIVHSSKIGLGEESEILVIKDTSSPPKPFREVSTLYNLVEGKLSEAFIEVYAPVEYKSNTERDTLKRRLEKPILDYLLNLSSSANEERTNGSA